MRARIRPRIAWLVWLLCIALVGVWILTVLRWAPLVERGSLALTAQSVLVAVTYPTVGALIASRRRKNPVGWVFLAIGLSFALSAVALTYGDMLGRPGAPTGANLAQWVNSWVWQPGWAFMVTFLLLLFPNGRLSSPRWRPVVWLTVIGLAAGMVGGALHPNPGVDPAYQNPVGQPVPRLLAELLVVAGFLLQLGAVAGSISALVVRFRRSTGEERQQLKWFTFAAVATVVLGVGRTVLAQESDVLLALGLASIPLLPVASLIAILKYRLYDIDLVINRTVLFGILAAFITAVYVGIVVGVGALVGRRGGIVLPGVAAAAVAVAFQPVRRRAGHWANRLVYGERATPYEVLSEFAERVGEVYSVDDTLPRMARIVGEGTGATRADVWLRVGTELRRAATWPSGATAGTTIPVGDDNLPSLPGADRVLPVRHQGKLLGALAVATARGQELRPAEEKLLSDLAAQAGLVLRNVRLTEELKAKLRELRASRQRLVAAQDEERRRLERNIHDGAQQQLVALSVRLRLAEQIAGKDPQRSAEMLAELRTQMQSALDDLRDLARGIYPPLLADRGLVAALDAQGRKAAMPVTVEAGELGRYPAEVEAGVYFCCLEALQNVAKYAGASRVVVRLWDEDGMLSFEVADDGRGFDPGTTPPGSGLQNMRDRIESLDGTLEVRSAAGQGTTVTGRLAAVRVSAAEPRAAETSPEPQHP